MRAVAMILAAAAYVASAIRDPVFGQQWYVVYYTNTFVGGFDALL